MRIRKAIVKQAKADKRTGKRPFERVTRIFAAGFVKSWNLVRLAPEFIRHIDSNIPQYFVIHCDPKHAEQAKTWVEQAGLRFKAMDEFLTLNPK